MAVSAGARRASRASLLLPRRKGVARERARRRTYRSGVALAAIAAAFLLGLFYLTQTLGTAMTRFDIEALAAEKADIEQRILSVEGDIARWGAEPAIIHGAEQAGFDRLGTSMRVPGR
jgi:hypothetical protein